MDSNLSRYLLVEFLIDDGHIQPRRFDSQQFNANYKTEAVFTVGIQVVDVTKTYTDAFNFDHLDHFVSNVIQREDSTIKVIHL